MGSAYTALLDITKTPIREFNLDPNAGIDVYRRGRPMLREMFGPDVGLPALSIPAVSYGHVNGLGADLTFPDDGEVVPTRLYSSLEEGIAALQQPVAFASAGMAPFYIEYRHALQAAFPDEPVGFSYGAEGPVTTAYLLRGADFLLDIMDTPDRAAEFLGLVIRSTLSFRAFCCKVLDALLVNPDGMGLCDDIASMVPPTLFPSLVLPYWEQHYRGMTTGKRHAHVEDLSPDHLPYLETIGLSRYDPSISPKLNPRIIAERCRVPFDWRLGNFHYWNLTVEEVRDFVFQAVADGASGVHTYVAHGMSNEETVPKVHAFIDAAKETARMFERGASREDIAQCVSEAGRKKFWEHWPE